MRSSYSRRFHREMENFASRSADIVVRELTGVVPVPRSVIDVGCSGDSWLRAFLRVGTQRAVGIQGELLLEDQATPADIEFIERNLEEPLLLNERFEMAICLEVAEHLPENKASQLVDGLCSLTDNVLFSAAIPSQGGTHHVNERWPEYWAQMFQSNGYEAFDWLRLNLWSVDSIAPWYRQNLLFYSRNPPAELDQYKVETPVSLVHPDIYLSKARVADVMSPLVKFAGSARRRYRKLLKG